MGNKETETNSIPETELPSYRCSVHIHRHSVDIYSETKNFLPFFVGNEDMDYVHDIPGWRIKFEPEEGRSRIVYKYSQKPVLFFDSPNKTMFISTPESDVKDGQVLAYLSYWLSEKERQEESSFSLHSAAVSIKKKGVLIIGDRGAGKTTTVMALAERYDAKLISNDLTIVSYDGLSKKVVLENGSKKIRLRLRSILARFPKLLDKFQDRNGQAWTTKVLVDPKVLGIQVETDPIELSQAFFIHVSNVEGEATVLTKAGGISPQFELYENLSRIIRGTAISLFDSNGKILGYVPSLESEETHNNKANFLNHLLSEKGVYSLAGGNLDQICQVICDLTKD